jgi:hypothetical protein
MRLLLPLLLVALGLLAQAAPPAAEKPDELPGAEGTFVRVPFDRENAQEAPEIEVAVGDEVELEWTYPIYPDAFPTKVQAKAGSEVAKLVAVRRVRVPTLVGVGRLGAFFKAEQPGETELALDVTTRAGVQRLRCRVKVGR